MKTCVECLSKNLEQINDTIEATVNDKKIVITDIQATKCTDCNEIYYDHAASRYIDKQIAIFKAESDG
ncbi:YgiT-type zinc finger protein [Paenibacillus sp. LPE1-1-1.1]|uniref:YgiT-type zinc finger protein n=1 Tax=Paenibacillus sp. LPE1-1-1.1 TaxID=3135230 RepID=UPI0034432EC7